MKQTKRIFLDSAAGEANPSGLYREAVNSNLELNKARRKVAEVLSAHADEIVFTSGGTEANNLALFGLQPKHLITTNIEHASVLEPVKELASRGGKVTFLSVDKYGVIDLLELEKALKHETDLVSVIYAHNEIGVVQDIKAIAKVIRKFRQKNKSRTPYLHTDACQAARFLELNVEKLGVDLLTLNSAKFSSSRGVGCLFVRRGINLKPLIFGGGQERGLRSGTENVAGIVKFAKALVLARKKVEQENAKLIKLRDYFINELLKIPGTELNGPQINNANRLANNVNVSFVGLDSEQIVLELDARGVTCSTGAACNVPERDASYVIIALGKSRIEALSAVRFTLNSQIRKGDINYVLKALTEVLEKLNSVKKLNKII